MALSSPFHIRSLRILGVLVVLIFASMFGFATSQASADDASANERSQFEPKSAEERALEQIGPGEAVATTDTPIADSAVDETARANALAGLSDTGFVAQTQNQQSIALIEGTFTEGGVLAGGEQPVTINGRGQVAYSETEHALAQNAIDTGFVGQSQNQQSIALSESRLVQNAIVDAEQAPQADSPLQTTF